MVSGLALFKAVNQNMMLNSPRSDTILINTYIMWARVLPDLDYGLSHLLDHFCYQDLVSHSRPTKPHIVLRLRRWCKTMVLDHFAIYRKHHADRTQLLVLRAGMSATGDTATVIHSPKRSVIVVWTATRGKFARNFPKRCLNFLNMFLETCFKNLLLFNLP